MFKKNREAGDTEDKDFRHEIVSLNRFKKEDRAAGKITKPVLVDPEPLARSPTP